MTALVKARLGTSSPAFLAPELCWHGDAPGVQSHWYYKDDILLAVDARNDPRIYMIGKRLIEAGRSPAPAAITDPATDMKALLKP